ncbi:MFS transporter [Desulfosporosinus sp. FKB]|uniref:MFS transporter n=1 Tax=Desulfosporosinus sp. FKB TaxID=1969835 RepID=UPI000B4A31ED|nr:MFS transporter [Desulfosporosinus sp. FKB]
MKEKLWTKDYLSITTLSFFIFLAFYVLLTALPLYLVGTLHAGADKVGLLVTLFLGAAIVIRPFAGRWLSKGAQKQILVYSTVAFFMGTLLYPFAAKNIWALLLLRVFHGMTFGVITTAKGTICAELIPASRRGEGLSYFSLAMSLAMVFGPFIGLKFAAVNAYNTAFITCMLISVVNIILAVIIKVPDIDDATKTLSEKSKFSWNDLFDKKAAPFALATFILACAYSGISAFFALYMKDLGLTSVASSFFLIYAGFIMISRPFTGRWSDQLGAKIIVYPCFVIFAIGMFLLSQSHASYLFLIAGALIGIGYGSVTPILQTQTIGSVEPHRVGLANSLFFNSMDAGMAIGAYALGIMASGSGYRSIYVAGVVLIIVTGLQYLVLTHNKETLEIQPGLSSEITGR